MEGIEMAKTVGAGIVCALLICSVFVAVNASSSGSEWGEFPDRIFEVNSEEPEPVEGISYLTTVTPGYDGYWSVEMTEKIGSYVIVQVYEGVSIHTKPLSSTDMRTVGQVSKSTLMSTGEVYTVAFTCNGKKTSATLQEHFEYAPPFPCTSHDPIYIHGNLDFTTENGVVGGDGSSASPYVISGWSIAASDMVDGIKVESTDAHFVIRECFVHSAWQPYAGIYLSMASNGVVENCALVDDFLGMFIEGCSNVGVTSNVVVLAMNGIALSDCTEGTISKNVVSASGIYGDACVSLFGCSGFIVEENYLTNGIWAVWIGGGSDCTVSRNEVTHNIYGIGTHSEYGESSYVPMLGIVISENTVTDNDDLGIYMATTCYGGVISGNTVSGNRGDAITVESGVEVIVKDNIVTDNEGSGVTVRSLSGHDTVIVGNKISGNGVGVSLEHTGLTTIYGNDFLQNTVQASQESTYGALWDNGLPDGGNYWSDYTGVDENHDGIGDTPYMIDSTHMDRYPLMRPFVP